MPPPLARNFADFARAPPAMAIEAAGRARRRGKRPRVIPIAGDVIAAT
jgi:hypothetical protein